MDPDAEGFGLEAWERERLAAARQARAEESARDLAWQEEFRTRRKHKDGAPLGASFVAVPRVDPQPGEPRFRLIKQDRPAVQPDAGAGRG